MTTRQTFQMTRLMRLGTALLKALLRAGVPLGPLALLSVRGRKSKQVYTTPVALVHHGHERWLVAAFGEVNWVRNLRAAGAAHLIRGRHTERIDVVELGMTDAAPILQRFLQAYHLVPFIPPSFSVTPHSPLAAFERGATHHPVFHIVSTNEKRRHPLLLPFARQAAPVHARRDDAGYPDAWFSLRARSARSSTPLSLASLARLRIRLMK